MHRHRRLLVVALVLVLPLLLSAVYPPKKPIEVYFSPGGGCTDAVVREIGRATKKLRIQAYSFTSKSLSE